MNFKTIPYKNLQTILKYVLYLEQIFNWMQAISLNFFFKISV